MPKNKLINWVTIQMHDPQPCRAPEADNLVTENCNEPGEFLVYTDKGKHG